MRLERATWNELPSVPELAALAFQTPELFLWVSESANKEDLKALIEALIATLPNHRVFDAGVREGRARITVLQVLPHSVIREHLERFHEAAWVYRQLANKLMPRLYAKLGLPRDADYWGTHPQTGQLDESWAYFSMEPTALWVTPKQESLSKPLFGLVESSAFSTLAF